MPSSRLGSVVWARDSCVGSCRQIRSTAKRTKPWNTDSRVNRLEFIGPAWPGRMRPDNGLFVLTQRVFMIFGLFVARPSEFRVLCASVALMPFRSVENPTALQPVSGPDRNRAEGNRITVLFSMQHFMKTQTQSGHRQFELKLLGYGNCYYIERVARLEAALARKPRVLQINLIGTGEIPADTALL